MERLFLREKKELLTDERRLKRKKLLLSLKMHKGNFRRFNTVGKKLQRLEDNLVGKLVSLNKSIATVNDSIKKLDKIKVDFSKRRRVLRGSLIKTNRAISKEERQIIASEAKLARFK